eukprot:1114833-Alexandrium_andersonii.AAC.1
MKRPARIPPAAPTASPPEPDVPPQPPLSPGGAVPATLADNDQDACTSVYDAMGWGTHAITKFGEKWGAPKDFLGHFRGTSFNISTS